MNVTSVWIGRVVSSPSTRNDHPSELSHEQALDDGRSPFFVERHQSGSASELVDVRLEVAPEQLHPFGVRDLADVDRILVVELPFLSRTGPLRIRIIGQYAVLAGVAVVEELGRGSATEGTLRRGSVSRHALALSIPP